ncbi:MAG: YkgJ family cysteine cluster protein [Candidatus Gastranaerophilales bacterium]|nr:YkgJ family cysteine cluster protein [Candidatus Gastranaerophilales bacterium]
MLIKYENYLEKINKKLDKHFNSQKEFIKCETGCSICCKNSYYPVSELEYKYIKIGIDKNFNEEQKESLNKKTIQIIKDRKKFLEENSNILDFYYECPFLTDNLCSIYEYRGLICRLHGLIYKDIENPNKHNAPYCMTIGFNYANVWDEQNKIFSDKKVEKLGLKARPEAYDLSYSSIMKQAGDIEFGNVSMLVEWIVINIPHWQELIKEDDAELVMN